MAKRFIGLPFWCSGESRTARLGRGCALFKCTFPEPPVKFCRSAAA
ncbi:MAG: hypothetical protein IJG60_06635 [Thermoguttaceae bacterium]|nr:hypothetical protein [Thermoguttaceae bacterium]